jgi:hypothetical protein
MSVRKCNFGWFLHSKAKHIATHNDYQTSDPKIDLSNNMNIPQEGVLVRQTRWSLIPFGEWESDHPTFVGLRKLIGLLNKPNTYEVAMLSIDR